MNKFDRKPAKLETLKVIYRGENAPGGYGDRYMFDGIVGATPEEAINEHALIVLNLDEGQASDRVTCAKIVVVDEYENPIKGHKVKYS